MRMGAQSSRDRRWARLIGLLTVSACAHHNPPSPSPQVQQVPEPGVLEPDAPSSPTTASKSPARPAPSAGPTPAPAPAQDSRGRGLPPGQVSEVVMKDYPHLRACYEDYFSGRPNQSGLVTLKWTIAPTGTVATAEVSQDTFPDESISSCLRARFLALRFLPHVDETRATWTFSFKPSARQ